MSEILQKAFRHHVWANTQLLDACETVPDATLDATVKGTYGTIRDTLVHLFAAEERYLSRMTDYAPEPPLAEGAFPGIDVLKARARSGGEKLVELAGTESADRVLRGEHPTRGKYAIALSTFFAQALNHATEHRVQIATVLTQQGTEPPDIDVWSYEQAAAGG